MNTEMFSKPLCQLTYSNRSSADGQELAVDFSRKSGVWELLFWPPRQFQSFSFFRSLLNGPSTTIYPGLSPWPKLFKRRRGSSRSECAESWRSPCLGSVCAPPLHVVSPPSGNRESRASDCTRRSGTRDHSSPCRSWPSIATKATIFRTFTSPYFSRPKSQRRPKL